jgi:hypothetical protein
MRAPMGSRHVLLALLAGLVAVGTLLGGCGKEIGDSCTLASDCSPNGDRICQCWNCSTAGTSSGNGYCTIQGCDYSTCPDEAVCVSFFTGGFDNKMCTQDTATTDCSLDELCSLAGTCVPRSSESRYCMRKCSSNDDCNDGYECRDITLMMEHGGEPVLAPNTPVDAAHLPKFCAARP